VHRDGAVALLPQDAVIEHRHHQQLPVRKPAEPGRLAVDAQHDLIPAVRGQGMHTVTEEVREPQAAVVPPWSLAEEDATGGNVRHRRSLSAWPSTRQWPRGLGAVVGHRAQLLEQPEQLQPAVEPEWRLRAVSGHRDRPADDSVLGIGTAGILEAHDYLAH
jgi:hypothetical protein